MHCNNLTFEWEEMQGKAREMILVNFSLWQGEYVYQKDLSVRVTEGYRQT